MALNYTPAFQHTDWIDNVSRVTASGQDGFNARFHAVEFEFQTLADVVTKVSQVLDALGQTPPPTESTITLVPVMVSTSIVVWVQREGHVVSATNAVNASGMQPVTLPDGVRLVRFVAVGEATGTGLVTVQLMRQAVVSTTAGQRIVAVEGSNGLFTSSQDVPGGDLATVDSARFKYFIKADWSTDTVGDRAALSAFQVVYLH